MPWYREKDYPKLRSLFVDGVEFPESYDEWVDRAAKAEHLWTVRGVEVVRIEVEQCAFSAWCKLKKIRPDAKARQRYARHGSLLGRPPKG